MRCQGFKGFIPLLFLVFLISGLNAQVKPDRQLIRADSTVSDSASADSLAKAKADSSLASQLQLKGRVLLSDINPDALRAGSTYVTATAPKRPPALEYLPPARDGGASYQNSEYDIRGSTAYQFTYADELQREDVIPKPEYGNGQFIVPILPMAYLALYGSYKGYMALKGEPPLSFDKTDIRLLNLLWQQPDGKPVDYYEMYNRLEKQEASYEHLTFMTLKSRLDKMLEQRIVESRIDGDKNQRLSTRHSYEELLIRLELELRSTDGTRELARRLAQQQMHQWLKSR